MPFVPMPWNELPEHALPFLLASRFCPGIIWAAAGDAVTCERCLDKLGRISDDN